MNTINAVDTDNRVSTTPNVTTSFEEIKIGDEVVRCRRIDLMQEFGSQFADAPFFRKVWIVSARQARERESIVTSQDWTKNYAEASDWIIQNPWDKDPYVFGDKNDPIDVRNAKFEKKYEPIDWEEGKFRPKGVIRALQVNEALVFSTSWWEDMAVKSGGWVADGWYSIAESSFWNTYQQFDPIEEDAKKALAIKESLIETPGKLWDKVVCAIDWKEYRGTIFNDDFSWWQLVWILLDEQIPNSNYLWGYGTILGIELLKDPKKIRKTWISTQNEIFFMEQKLAELINSH